MSGANKDEARRLLPRWRTWRAALALPEAAATASVGEEGIHLATRASVSSARHLAAQFDQRRDLGTALDALGGAVVAGAREYGLKAAQFVVESVRDQNAPAVVLAKELIGGEPALHLSEQKSNREMIAWLRRRLVMDPRDAMSAIDLARLYAVVGKLDKSRRLVHQALRAAPNSRFILRSSSRFLIHAAKPDEAWLLLRRAEATKTDPWLAAAEISAAMVAERSPAFVKAGREMLTRGQHSPIELSELAGSLASLELREGAGKSARRLFAASLIQPTENALAQARWATKFVTLDAVPSEASVPLSFEAAALHAYEQANWQLVLESCRDWLADEPFSHRSAVLGSFVASTVVDDYSQAISFARAGLRANPAEQTLRNNLVFALARAGRTQAAIEEASLARPELMDTGTKIAWTATYGLLNYRLGLHAVGREYYGRAIEWAKKLGGSEAVAVAALNWIRAATEALDPELSAVRSEALPLTNGRLSEAIQTLRTRILEPTQR